MRPLRAIKALSLVTAVAGVATFGGFLPQGALTPQVASGLELWRVVTHLFVHLNVEHLLVNLLGLIGLAYLWPQLLESPAPAVRVFIPYAVGAPFLASGPVYGASGLLHGLFCYGALVWAFSRQQKWQYAFLLSLGMTVKLLAEAFGWAPTQGVAWHYHVLGAISGALAGVYENFQKQLNCGVDEASRHRGIPVSAKDASSQPTVLKPSVR